MNVFYSFRRLILKMKTLIIAFCVILVVANSLAGKPTFHGNQTSFASENLWKYDKQIVVRYEIICARFVSSQVAFISSLF